MEFDEYDYLERTVENPEPQKVRESVNGGDDTVKSGEKDRHRSSRHKSDEKDDGNDENHRAKRSRSGDENRDHERRKEGKSSRHRSRSRDGDRDRDWGTREPKDRDRDRENRNGKDGDKDRERERDRERDRPRDRKDRDRDSEREREQSRRSGSRSERHRSERDERDREKSRDRDREFKEREKEREIRERDRESRKKKEEVAEPVADPERDQRTVFAYQISLKADERDVYEFFSRAGKVRDVRLIMDRNSRRSKGVGYIEFFDVMSVPMAIALSGQLLLGQPVMVKPSEAEKNLVQSTNTTTGGSGAAGPYSGGARRLYVGNLHVNITEDQLRQVFESFGQVELVQLPLDEAGNCKGFGFVQFVNLEDSRNALSLDGQLEIAGRKIKVSNVTDSSGMQDAGMKPADLDDDEGAGLLSNARDRALLIQKLARTDIAPSGTASLTTPMVGTGITMPTAPILGTPAALVSPAVLPILQGPVPALPGFPAGLQHPSTAVSPVDTIGVPSECLLLTNMFDPKVETEPDFDLDIKEDVEGECSKYGTLKHIYVDKNSAGFVYLRFNDTKSAISAQRSLHGRWFAGKMITATFMVPLKYEAEFPDSQ